ncbi:MAG: DNA-binding domain-containing protein [Amphritea sp.]
MVSEQQLLIEAIYGRENTGLCPEGVDIYRNNLTASARRALAISYPTVVALLGEELFALCCQQFLSRTPPTDGDWAQWGDLFTVFLSAHPALKDYPYICDCAELDWKLHQANQGADQLLDQSTLGLLANGDPHALHIEFNMNLNLVISAFPIELIYMAHHSPLESQRQLAMAQAKVKIQQGGAETVLVYRPQFKPLCKGISEAETTFIATLIAGYSLADALDAVSEDNFSFQQWLISAIENNLIVSFRVANADKSVS